MKTFGLVVSLSEANMTQRITPEYSDNVFEGIEFPDNKEILLQTRIAKRELSGWYEKNKERYGDAEYKERWRQSIKDRYADPEIREMQSRKVKGVPKSEIHKQRVREARLKAPPRSADTRKKLSDCQLGNQRRAKPIVTPFGVFASLKLAGDQLNILRNFRNGRKVVCGMMQKNPKEYYYITREEYDKLTK